MRVPNLKDKQILDNVKCKQKKKFLNNFVAYYKSNHPFGVFCYTLFPLLQIEYFSMCNYVQYGVVAQWSYHFWTRCL